MPSGEIAKGAGAVGDGGFLLQRQLSGGLAERRVEENRVVAEAVFSCGFSGNLTVDPRLGLKQHHAFCDHSKSRHESRVAACVWMREPPLDLCKPLRVGHVRS